MAKFKIGDQVLIKPLSLLLAQKIYKEGTKEYYTDFLGGHVYKDKAIVRNLGKVGTITNIKNFGKDTFIIFDITFFEQELMYLDKYTNILYS